MAPPAHEGQFRPRRPFRRRRSWGTVLLFAVLTLLAVRRGCESFSPDRPRSPETLAEGVYDVVRVVDGDTIIVRPPGAWPGRDSQQARVRLLGIDTPETVQPNHPVEPWGPEATEFTREFLVDGEVELRLDRRRKDRYDRFLAYVYVEDRLLNEELVRAGLARAEAYPGDSPQIARQLQEAEEAARRAKIGLWSE
ncbi:MAG: thermonuclease family protein [Planctomycetes bacterium]|nr:thermonuclease family protein [Planctomycetota bacterium]